MEWNIDVKERLYINLADEILFRIIPVKPIAREHKLAGNKTTRQPYNTLYGGKGEFP